MTGQPLKRHALDGSTLMEMGYPNSIEHDGRRPHTAAQSALPILFAMCLADWVRICESSLNVLVI